MQLLKNPYPAPEGSSRSIIISLGIGLFIGSFLAFFQPFNISALDIEHKIFKIYGYGLITFLITFLFLYLLPRFLPNVINEKHWTVGKELLFFVCMILSIACLNSLYTSVLSGSLPNVKDLGIMLANTFILGCIPTFFVVLLDHNQKLNKHVQAVEEMDIDRQKEDEHIQLQIPTDAQHEIIELNTDQFLYAESEGNYITIFQESDNEVKKGLYRFTLTKLDQALPLKHLIRCHRSYIINLQKVTEVNGNAQGFKLSVEGIEDKVPVSRKFVPIVKEYFSESA